MSLIRIQSSARLVRMPATVTDTAVQNSCERLDSSRSEKMATNPATSSTATNSSGYCRKQAQVRTIVEWAIKAVRESMNTRIKMGTIANGTIYTCSTLCSTIAEAIIVNSTMSAYNMVVDRTFSK